MYHKDWYLGSDDDDFIVPKDQEPSYRFPSPDHWLQWEITAEESFGLPNTDCVRKTNLTKEELNFNEKILHDQVDCSGGNPEASLCITTLLDDRLDYQLDDLARMDQMDDIFLSSLLEEDLPDPESQYSMMWLDNLPADMIVDSWDVLRDLSGMAPVVKGMIPSELNSPCKEDGLMCEEMSLEESLHEFEAVMTKLTQKTRICFRDALYRLSKSSQQRHMLVQSQSGDITMDKLPLSAVPNETLRLGRMKSMELETNSIDRSIASLMFNKMNFDAGDLSAVTSVCLSREAVATTGSCNYNLCQPWIPHCNSPPMLPGDAEVPVFSREKTKMNLYKEFSRTDSVSNNGV
ncbi:hypothetical protein HHK36_011774 [Tetracentron sinense]|uniref:Uncharacterized protein n=1 Tax=Tetracentron sinense TaxID=13715 RepID=A0A834ZB20_TETSI|nr:hypothetical protein HHK36_011774 [Tetracentron sinense]